jgi:hypothetical protein
MFVRWCRMTIRDLDGTLAHCGSHSEVTVQAGRLRFRCSCDIVVELVRASKGCADPNGLQFTCRDLAGGFIPEPWRS